MHFVSWRGKLLGASLFIGGIFVGICGLPVWRTAVVEVYAEEYMRLVAECDWAMREHLIAKHRVEDTPSSVAVEMLKSAEISLIACQDYDLFQKKLKLIGLRDNELSILRLRTVEQDPEGLQWVVAEHELRY